MAMQAIYAKGANPKTTLYVGGLQETINESVLHSAFIPFGDIKDVNIPLDHATQKHRGFGFVEFLEPEDAAAAIDNMNSAELYNRVLRVNYAQPIRIKGGEAGWASQAVWADADTWVERQQQEEELARLKEEQAKTLADAAALGPVPAVDPNKQVEEVEDDAMAAAEREALAEQNGNRT
eukprot:jgi/Chlat1/6549/Chrsp45S06012